MSQQYPPDQGQPQPPYQQPSYPQQPPQYPQQVYGDMRNQVPLPKSPRKRRRWPFIVGGILVLVIVIIIIASAASGGDNSAASNPTPSGQATAQQHTTPSGQATTQGNTTHNTPTATPTPKSIAQQVSAIVANAGMLGKVTTTYGYTDNPKAVVVKDDIGDGNLTNDLTVGEIHLECFTAQKALWTAHLDLSEVLVQVNMNVVDQYGKQSNQLVATCDLVKATEQQFVWENLDQESAWPDYDNTMIAPFLTK